MLWFIYYCCFYCIVFWYLPIDMVLSDAMNDAGEAAESARTAAQAILTQVPEEGLLPLFRDFFAQLKSEVYVLKHIYSCISVRRKKHTT